MTNSIVAENTASYSPDVSGFNSRTGVNLIGRNEGSSFAAGSPNANGDYIGTAAAPLDPKLAPLANNGGPTRTMAPLAGSLARDHASVLNPAITSDQRGFSIVGTPDIGAYEAGTTNSFALWSAENAGAPLVFTGDTDLDGIQDGLEYATRGSLTGPTANPFSGPVSIPGTGTQFAFPYRAGATDLLYIVQRSSNLTNWTEIYRYNTATGLVTEQGVVGDENAATQVITLTDPTVAAPNFWRLRVQRSP
jgi:hypothetical protein